MRLYHGTVPDDLRDASSRSFNNHALPYKRRWIAEHASRTIMWVVWKARNRRIFHDKAKEARRVVIDVKEMLFDCSRGNSAFKGGFFADFMLSIGQSFSLNFGGSLDSRKTIVLSYCFVLVSCSNSPISW